MSGNIRYINMCLISCIILYNDLNKYHFKKNDQEKIKKIDKAQMSINITLSPEKELQPSLEGFVSHV